jgi:hypothetical protein
MTVDQQTAYDLSARDGAAAPADGGGDVVRFWRERPPSVARSTAWWRSSIW